MSTFRLYLWKEWREQRTALLALGLSIVVLGLLIGHQLPRGVATSASFVGGFASVAAALALITVGGELLGSETRRGQSWLERLPHSLPAAFPAKLFFFLATSSAALLLGLSLGLAVVNLRGGNPASPLRLEHDLEHIMLPLAATVLVMPWVFAASAWCARGTLALLAGCLLTIGFAWPVLALPFAPYFPEPLELVLAFTLNLGSALLCAWFGFTRGVRGASATRRALRGLRVGALGMAPLSGWALVQLDARTRIDLASPDCELEGAWISRDGEVAVIAVSMDLPRWAQDPVGLYRIELASGVAHRLPFRYPTWSTRWTLDGPKASATYQHFVLEEDGVQRVLSAETGDELPPLDGEASEVLEAGAGYSLYDDGCWFYDPYVDVTLEGVAVGIHWDEQVWIGPRGWYIRGDDWRTFDPLTHAHTPTPWLAPLLTILESYPDGRLLGLNGEARLVLADPALETCQPVRGRAFQEFPWIADTDLQGPQETLLEDDQGLYRLDLECLELEEVPLAPGDWPQRRLASGDLLLATEDGFVRLRTDGTREPIVRFAALEVVEEVTP